MTILENSVSPEKYGWNAEQPAMAWGNADLAVAPWGASACAKSIAYQIGGISFALFPEGDVQLTLDPALRDFAIYPPKKRTSCDVNISVSLVDESSDASRASRCFIPAVCGRSLKSDLGNGTDTA